MNLSTYSNDTDFQIIAANENFLVVATKAQSYSFFVLPTNTCLPLTNKTPYIKCGEYKLYWLISHSFSVSAFDVSSIDENRIISALKNYNIQVRC